MENTLWAQYNYYEDNKWNVLILVIMENTLWVDGKVYEINEVQMS